MMKTVFTALLVLAGMSAASYAVLHSSGVAVVVRNVGPNNLQSVIVYVTGRSYPMGDIATGEAARIVVKPTGESNIEIEHGVGNRHIVDCYFEPGYSGSIAIEFLGPGVHKVENEIRVGVL